MNTQDFNRKQHQLSLSELMLKHDEYVQRNNHLAITVAMSVLGLLVAAVAIIYSK